MKDITTHLSMANQYRVINRKKFAQICSKEKNLGISVLSNCTSAIELTPVFEAEDSVGKNTAATKCHIENLFYFADKGSNRLY